MSETVNQEQNTAFPIALNQRVWKHYGGAAIIAFLSIICAIVFESAGYLVGLLGAAYLVWTGVRIRRRWFNGKIVCQKMECVSAKSLPLSNGWTIIVLRIVDALEDDESAVKTFHISSNKKDVRVLERGILLNAYWDIESPKELLCWHILG